MAEGGGRKAMPADKWENAGQSPEPRCIHLHFARHLAPPHPLALQLAENKMASVADTKGSLRRMAHGDAGRRQRGWQVQKTTKVND